MSSIIIVTTPSSCLHCEFCVRSCTEPTCRVDDLLGGKHNSTWDKLDEVPDWCPLIRMPSKKEPDSHGYNAGWNDCIKAMLSRGNV